MPDLPPRGITPPIFLYTKDAVISDVDRELLIRAGYLMIRTVDLDAVRVLAVDQNAPK